MREYETTFIIQPEISEEGCAELLGRVDTLLEREGAERLLHDDQGRRRLAYEIQRFQKGRYVTSYFLDERGKSVEPLERLLRLEESVLRFLTVLKAEAVADVEARRSEAKEQERVQAERARERAEREAEEEKARQAAREAADQDAARRAALAEEAEAAAKADPDTGKAADAASSEADDGAVQSPSDESEKEQS